MKSKTKEKAFNVLIGPDKQLYQLNCKILPLWEKTDIIRSIYENLQTDEPIELDQKKTNKEFMDFMVNYLEIHDYNPPKIILPIKSNKPEECLHPKDYILMKNFQVIGGEKLSNLCNFAKYMQMRPLFSLCCARIAIELFCGQNFENYLLVKAKLGVQKEITYQDYDQLKTKYSWIEN